MADYTSTLTGAQISGAIEAVNGLMSSLHNGKIVTIGNGKFETKDPDEISEGSIDPITITANGAYTHALLGGYSPVTVAVDTGLTTGVAIVVVTKEAGYACTATQGSREYTSPTTGTQYMFCLPVSGTWTFVSNGVTKTVTLADYECTSIAVLNRTYIYESGTGAAVTLYTYAQRSAVITDDDTKINLVMNASGYVQTCIRNDAAIDITNYNTLYFDLECTALGSETAYQGRFVVSSTTFQVDSFNHEIDERIVVNSTRHIKSIDISSLTGEMYLGVSGAWAGNIYNIYLE